MIFDLLAANNIVFQHASGPHWRFVCVHSHRKKTSTRTFIRPRCSSSQALYFSTVPALSEEGRQQAADYAAEEETLQEPNHPGLQDLGGGGHQHGRGTAPRPPLNNFPFESVAPPPTPALASLHCVTGGEGSLVSHVVPHDAWSSRIPLCEITEAIWSRFQKRMAEAGTFGAVLRCAFQTRLAVASIANRYGQYDGCTLKHAAAN